MIFFSVNDKSYHDDIKNTDWIIGKLKNERNDIKNKILSNNSPYNYKYIRNVMSNDMCDLIINESEKYASNNISTEKPDGWTHSRHANYPTTDLPINNIENLKTIVMNIVKIDIFEIISKAYNVNKYHLDCNDVFVVKYTAEGQNKLDKHRDGSAFSFNVLLNSPNDFIGGGTIIEENGKEILVSNTKGGMILHTGSCLHQGRIIEKGERYILVGFISYLKNFDSNLININKNLSLNFEKIINHTHTKNEVNFKSWNIQLNNQVTNIKKLIDACNMKETFLLDTNKNDFNILEKIVFELAMFHFNRLGIKYNPELHYIEFWTKKETVTKQKIHNFHSDKDEKCLKKKNILLNPLLSTVTYLTDSYFPTIITNIPEKNENLNNVIDKSILLLFPNKLKHISFDGKYLHGVANVSKNIPDEFRLEKKPRHTIMFNLWDKKPLDVEYNKSENDEKYIKSDNIINGLVEKNLNENLTFITGKHHLNMIVKNFVVPGPGINFLSFDDINNDNDICYIISK